MPSPFLPRRSRVSTLRLFLHHHLNLALSPSSTVLDVAGGKGDLSWLLLNADGLDAVTVDPRPADHSKLAKTAAWCDANPEEARARAEGEVAGVGQGMALLNLPPSPHKAPKRLRLFVDAALLEALEEAREEEWPDFFERASGRSERDEARSSTDPRAKKRKTEKEEEEEALQEGAGSNRVTDAAKARKLLATASAVVAFHPDSATEPAIDLALSLRVPFAVCPCCVFPSLCPERAMEGGKRVVGYEDFMVYLKAKHPRMREGVLDFESRAAGEEEEGGGRTGARNRVLWMRAEDFAERGGEGGEVAERG